MDKSLSHYFQVQSRYYLVAQFNQKTSIPLSSRWQVRSEKPKVVPILISLSQSQLITIKSYSFLTNAIGKDGVQVIPSLESWPTSTKEAPSLHEVRLTPLDTNTVFQCLEAKGWSNHAKQVWFFVTFQTLNTFPRKKATPLWSKAFTLTDKTLINNVL